MLDEADIKKIKEIVREEIYEATKNTMTCFLDSYMAALKQVDPEAYKRLLEQRKQRGI